MLRRVILIRLAHNKGRTVAENTCLCHYEAGWVCAPYLPLLHCLSGGWTKAGAAAADRLGMDLAEVDERQPGDERTLYSGVGWQGRPRGRTAPTACRIRTILVAMSVTEAEIQWFIARDGKQHGPVSDVEMRKLVELGHLRSSDLLWRLGFPDWRPAPAVFSPPATVTQAPPPKPDPVPQQELQPQASQFGPAATLSMPAQSQPAKPAFQSAPAQTIAPRFEPIAAPAPAVQPAPMATPGFGTGAPGPMLSSSSGPSFSAAANPAAAPMAGPQAGASGSLPGSLAALRSDAPTTGGRPARQPGGSGQQGHHGHHHHGHHHHGQHGHAASAGHGSKRGAPVGLDDMEPRKSGALKRVGIAVVLAALLGGGGWFAYKNQDMIKGLLARRAASAGQAEPAAADGGKPAVEAAAAAAATPATAISADELDARLQKLTHWSLIRQQFGEWYQARVKEASRLSTTNKTEMEVAAYLAQGLVELRRSHADKALAASNASLEAMATAFSANVGKLGQESTNACMAFILKGEASPPVVEIIENPAKNSEINAHFAAIFSAVGEGTKSPVQHNDPTEGDYQLLVAQLTKLGWAPGDLQLFADPRGPSKTSPDRYCKMMHEFFTAHLAVEDPAARDRLLYRTLKLVVAG